MLQAAARRRGRRARRARGAHLAEHGERLEGHQHDHEVVDLVRVGAAPDDGDGPQHAQRGEEQEHGLRAGAGGPGSTLEGRERLFNHMDCVGAAFSGKVWEGFGQGIDGYD